LLFLWKFCFFAAGCRAFARRMWFEHSRNTLWIVKMTASSSTSNDQSE
jgi:hypothetical protein